MSVRPDTRLVAKAWLKDIARLGGRVAHILPTDIASWSASGFTTVQGIGGTPHSHLPIAVPIVSVHCWAVSELSDKPPWGIAFDIAEAIRTDPYGVYDEQRIGRVLTDFPARYSDAKVLNALMVSEPVEIPSDPFNYAHVSFNLELHWIALP